MNLVLVDTNRENFLPLTFTRPVASLRLGILTIAEKWEKALGLKSSFKTEEYLQEKFPLIQTDDNLYISGALLPNELLLQQIKRLQPNEALAISGEVVVCRSTEGWGAVKPQMVKEVEEAVLLEDWWDLFLNCGEVIKEEFFKRAGAKALSSTNTLIGDADDIYVHPDATVEGVTLNTTHGPIFIEEGVEIMEGSCLRGPLVILKDTKVKMGAKIYGPTSIGPKCRAGGEIKNCIILGYSNKSHEGYLGNSVVGEWVNLGADTNCSNLKNTFKPAKVWSYEVNEFVQTDQTFIGSCFGDYAKTAIGTRINTGSVVGVNANVFGDGLQPKYIPNFAWGSEAKGYRLDKAKEVNQHIAEMEGVSFTEIEGEILSAIYQL